MISKKTDGDKIKRMKSILQEMQLDITHIEQVGKTPFKDEPDPIIQKMKEVRTIYQNIVAKHEESAVN